MEQQSNPKQLATKPKFAIVYQGKIFEVIRWEGKPGVMFEAAVRAPGVRLIIETEKDGQKGLLMTKELRREAEGFDYRLPGGKVFDNLEEYNQFRSKGGDISAAAKLAAVKEGREEAGVLGGDISQVGISKAGATVEWDLHYYLVKNAKLGKQNLEEHEQGDVETITLSAHEIFEKLVAGEIQEGRSADVLWRWLAKNNFVEFVTDLRA